MSASAPLCADNTFPADSVRSAKIKKCAIRAEREAGSGKREAGSGKREAGSGKREAGKLDRL
ncbi:hypothetical protein KBX73_13395 [Acetobacter persici]|uniref:hypothetical protein n=1 Tax=Acetobacter persici TaxID=1076596 RepID=UPI0020CD4FFE|nr:hypothetical protein [Acetobacter persici]MCP9320748.1 hypothetical protein [Acetobacter persici]